MAERIELPVYYEDQVLGAADLNAAVDLSTGQLARHERYQHRWGIAAGLRLEAEGKTTAANKPYVDVTCTAGVAIDGRGREIVVAEDELLNPSSFEQANVFVADAFHPVILAARDESPSAASASMGSCFTGQVSRRQQSFEIRFGRPGDQLDLDDQEPPSFLDGPGEGGWNILLGYVKYDATLKKFTEVSDSTEGIGRRHAGVQADEVVARSGKIVVRSNSPNEAGKPALALDSTADKALVFGLQDGAGGITELLSVDAKGNLKAAGAIGTVLVSESGLVSDGMFVPLPEGVAEDTVADGKVRLQIHLSPFFTPGPPDPTATGDDWIMHPRECRVDGRRVRCRFTWVQISTASRLDLPGVCNYLVVAYTPKE